MTTAVIGGSVLLAPTELGGRTGYVITQGDSMLPTFEPNGLVITRVEAGYSVGDVVAYHHKRMGAVVMHRIVALAGERYVLKGDNNGYRDRYRPSADEIVGKEWFYWAGAGAYIQLLRQPLVFGVIIALVAVLSLQTPRGNRRRWRHRVA